MCKIVFVIMLMCVLGCSSSADVDDDVYGNWIYVNTNTAMGAGGTLRDNGTYTLLALQVTSDTTVNVQLENGNLSVSPERLTMTPTESTCSAAEKGSYKYTLKDSVLTVFTPNGILAMERNTASPSRNIVITYGCFVGGKFSPSRLTPLK